MIEIRKRDAEILSCIIFDYLDNVTTENNVTRACELLLAKLGHYNFVEEYHKKYPLPSMAELLEGGLRPSVAESDRKAMYRFHNRLEIIDAAFKLAHGRKKAKTTKAKAIELSEVLR